jgi:hypothetical protein
MGVPDDFTAGYLAALKDFGGPYGTARWYVVEENPELAARRSWEAGGEDWLEPLERAWVEATKIAVEEAWQRLRASKSDSEYGGTVYVIGHMGSRTVKIGWTRSANGDGRRRTIQSARGEALVMLAEQPGSEDDEARLHRRFVGDRMPRGEWFYASAAIVSWLKELANCENATVDLALTSEIQAIACGGGAGDEIEQQQTLTARNSEQSKGSPPEKRLGTTPRVRAGATPEIARIWDHYQRVILGAHARTLEAKRRRIISKALDVRSEQQCCEAISGLASSPHHNGQNDRRKKYLDIRYALSGIGKEGDDERIDKMAEKAPRQGSSLGTMSVRDFVASLSPIAAETVWNHVNAINRMREKPDHPTLRGAGEQSEHELRGRFKVELVEGAKDALRRLEGQT